jgi:hypothetical protein
MPRAPQHESLRPLHLMLALLGMAVPPLTIDFAVEQWGVVDLSGAAALLVRDSITGVWLCFCGLLGLYGPDVLAWWRRN